MTGAAEILRDIDSRGLTEIVATIAARHGAPIGEIAIPTTDAGRKARNESWSILRQRGMRIATLGRVWSVDNNDVLEGILAWEDAHRTTAPPPPSAMTAERIEANERTTKAKLKKKAGAK